MVLINNPSSNELIKSINASKKQPSKFKLPKINVLADADNILKNRERSHGISTNPLICRSALKKSDDVRLKNYMIREIIKKREEIKEIEKSMTEEIQKKEKGYADYYFQRNRIIFAKRNNDKAANKVKSVLWIFANTIVRGILIDRRYFKRIPYYVDGLIGFDRFAGARKLRI